MARESGVTVRTLHHYDRLGLLIPASRTGGGHRCYTEADVLRLHRIVALRGFGFPLEEIGTLLDTQAGQDARGLSAEDFAALMKKRADAFAAMSPAERERLQAARARMIPPGVEIPGAEA
ncbi:MerR family transcriptional regulator [Nocardia sp. NPDC020380]|uniref:MerR family transcriptional regulator n=1 Tax=Nocardia sp. NPDC020380 TaxID=3364309 RepID=UPI00378C2925